MGLFNFMGKKEKSVKTKDKPSRAIDPEMALWQKMRNDKVYCSLQDENGRLHEEISADYSVLYNLGITEGPQVDSLEKKCLQAISTIELLIPLWEKYNQPLPTMCEPAKRLSMIREKQGRYEDAAFACAMALRLGMPDDGTAGGFRGRLARMVKKGGLEVTPEIQKLLDVK